MSAAVVSVTGPSCAVSRSQPGQRRQAWLAALALAPVAGLSWACSAGQWLPGQPIGTATAGFLILLLAVCTWTDLTHHKIYNWATYTAVLWALLWNTLVSCLPLGPELVERSGAIGLSGSLLGLGAGFGLMLVVYHVSGGGAGDVKLAAALGAWMGAEQVVAAVMFTYLAAGIVLLCWIVWTVGPVRLGAALLRGLGRLLLPGFILPPSEDQGRLLRQPVPMAPFFLAGTLAVLLGIHHP